MSSAARLARWNSRSRSWAGQDREFGQRQSTSPGSRVSAVPQLGHSAGNSKGRSPPVRRSATGPTISGITSPALRSTTVSPMSTPLRAISSALCSVAAATVDPDVEQPGGDLLGRVLVGDRPSRRAAGRPERLLQGDPVDLNYHAVDLVR